MTSSFHHRDDFLGIFARHPVAANLLMAVMIISGLWALDLAALPKNRYASL